MNDLIRLDAATLADKIATKEVSSAEVTRAYLDQIAATDERYHAFLHVSENRALGAAARVDAAVAAGEDLPRHWPVSRLPSRTCSPRPTCPPPAGRRSWRAGVLPTTQR